MTISVTSQKVCPPSRVRAYKGVHKPRCNSGLGCPECWDKWSAVNEVGRNKRQKRGLRKAA